MLQAVFQGILILGAVVGSFGAAPMSDFMGRLKGILFSNFIMWVSFGMILASPYKGGPILFFCGCFIYGIAVGFFSFLTPKYITETAPLEISGKLGSLHQLSICVGILIGSLFGPIFKTLRHTNVDGQKLFVIYFFAAPLFISLVQIILLLSVYNYDTP